MRGTGMKQLMVAAILAGVMVPSTAVFGEDAYIENMGGQFLNTGYCVCTNTRIEIDFQMLEIGSNKYLFSSATGNQTGYKDNLECSVSNSLQSCFPKDHAKAKIFTPDFQLTYKDYQKYNFCKDAELLYILDN